MRILGPLVSCLIGLAFLPARGQTAPIPLISCSPVNIGVCARVQFEQAPTPTIDNTFILTMKGTLADFKELKIAVVTTGFEARLNAPAVDIVEIGNNRFQVRNVWFAGPGISVIKIDFYSGQQNHQISIPVQVLN